MGQCGWVIWDNLNDFMVNCTAAHGDHIPEIPFSSNNVASCVDNNFNTVQVLANPFPHDTDDRVTAWVYTGWPDSQRYGHVYKTKSEVYDEGFSSVGTDEE